MAHPRLDIATRSPGVTASSDPLGLGRQAPMSALLRLVLVTLADYVGVEMPDEEDLRPLAAELALVLSEEEEP